MARVITLVPWDGIGPEVDQSVARVCESTTDVTHAVRRTVSSIAFIA